MAPEGVVPFEGDVLADLPIADAFVAVGDLPPVIVDGVDHQMEVRVVLLQVANGDELGIHVPHPLHVFPCGGHHLLVSQAGKIFRRP